MALGDGSMCRHVRKIQLRKSPRQWIVADEIHGSGEHNLNWFFHLHPDIAVQLREPDILLSAGPGHDLVMTINGLSSREATLEESWYSPRYGFRVATKQIRVARKTALPFTCSFEFRFTHAECQDICC